MNEGTVAGPGSEYANAAVPGGRGEVNPVTGLRKTRNNPSGTPCSTPICLGRKRVDHDWNNCFQAGGGRAGQAPWQKGKGGAAANTPQVAAVAGSTPSTTNTGSQLTGVQTNTQVAAAAIQCPPTEDYFRNLSCAMLEELHDAETGGNLACHAAVASSTILDSGTTTHLIRDSSFFWTFTRDSTVSMKTANQGSLNTEGYGDCVAVLKLGGKRIRLKLEHCLYAPNAVVNLLSVGRMVERGWELRFRGEPSRCELIHSNESLGSIDMRGQLCFLDVEFVRPPDSSQTPVTGLTAFTPATLTWDLWHARLGHLGGDIARFLPTMVTGVQVTSSAAQTRCESCIIAKHPRQPFPLWPFSNSNVTWETILHYLHRRDAWQMVKARWENHFGAKVKAIQTDNGGEYMGNVFTTSLSEGSRGELWQP